MATFHRSVWALFFVSLAPASFATGLNFTGRFEAQPSDTFYQDQRGTPMTCASGVKVTIQHRPDSLDLRVDYDCGEYPAGNRIIPLFMRGWRPLSILNGDLVLDNSTVVGQMRDTEFTIESGTTSGFPQVESKVRFWADSLHPTWLFFENSLRMNGMDMRYLRAHMTRTAN